MYIKTPFSLRLVRHARLHDSEDDIRQLLLHTVQQ